MHLRIVAEYAVGDDPDCLLRARSGCVSLPLYPASARGCLPYLCGPGMRSKFVRSWQYYTRTCERIYENDYVYTKAARK